MLDALTAALIAGVASIFSAWLLAVALRGVPRAARLVTYRLMLPACVLPWAFHVVYLFSETAGRLADGGPPPLYAGLMAFAALNAVIGPVLLALALRATLRFPPLASLLPLFLFAIYHRLLIPFLSWEAPVSPPSTVDAPARWLYVYSVAATLFLFTFSRDLMEEDEEEQEKTPPPSE